MHTLAASVDGLLASTDRLGTLVQFGWEKKAVGDRDGLGWWCEAARDRLRRL